MFRAPKYFLVAALTALLLIGCAPLSAAALYTPLPQAPRIVATVYPTDDVVIADIVLTEAPYAADGSGLTDCTQTIQDALNDCYAAGGGTVFLPAGRYLVTGPIRIPAFVTLRGDWQDPDTGNDYGTVILADVPSADTATPALFTVGGSAGAMGLTVYYPSQSLADVKPYPFAFYVNGGGADFMLQSVVNCTVINGYRGLGVCVTGEGHEMMTAEGFKGTFLHVGAEAYNQSDVGTWKNVSIGNQYWSQAGAGLAAADRGALDAYTKAHATGLILGDLEWTEFANLAVSGCKTGVHIVKGRRIEFAGSMVGVDIADCVTGLLVDSIDNRWGMAVAKGSIAGCTAVENNAKGYVKLTDVTLDGKVKGCGKVVQYCAGLSELDINYNRAPVKCRAALFIVQADNNRESDISVVLQQALDEAGSAGGGVVYLPAGRYLLQRPVTVPAGVELRGSGSVATREQINSSRGTLIYADWGEAATDAAADSGQALITLAGAHAGLRNLRFVYPGNIFVPDGVKPFNYTVRGAAQGVYAVNVCFTGSYNGVDFRGCNGHLIKKLVGVCYNNTMAVGGKNGMVEGCLQNANIAFRNDFQIAGWPVGEEQLFSTLINPITRQMSKIIRAQGAENQLVLNTFAYGAKHFLVSEDSGVRLVNIGADNLLENSPMLVTTGGSVTAVNMMRYNGYSFQNGGADLALYNRLTIGLKYEPTLDGSFRARFLTWLASVMNPLAAFWNKINPFG